MSGEETELTKAELLEMAADIVSAYVSNNEVKPENLPALIESVYASIEDLANPSDDVETGPRPDPAVPIADSLTEDYLICLEDGLQFQSLKRHLRVKYNMTPEAYREKWGLPRDYPMVAPNYAKRRSALAKKTGLGKNRP